MERTGFVQNNLKQESIMFELYALKFEFEALCVCLNGHWTIQSKLFLRTSETWKRNPKTKPIHSFQRETKPIRSWSETISQLSDKKNHCDCTLHDQLQIISPYMKTIMIVHCIISCCSYPLDENHGRSHNLKNGKEASEVTEGKSSRMRWGM